MRSAPAARPGTGLDIVHLAFEDYRRPGSGGGGVRTHEVNRRLAERHRVTVVTARYPGARRRVEDGVHYRPLGLSIGYFGNVITYHLSLPFYVALHRADLVVEDFAAPISSALIPLFTRRPTLAVVQWLFAREVSRHYRVPFFVFEELGVRLHRRFVAVSEYIAGRILAANPDATVEVAPAGVSLPALVPAPEVSPDRILYLGRIQWAAKGLDLLLESFSRLLDLSGLRLVVAGDGPDRARLAAEARRLGIADRIEMVGRVEGEAKWRLLASSTVLAMTSRYETFGLVVAEAAAVGTPVVAFDLPALRETMPPGAGVLVPPGDVTAFSDALRHVIGDPAARSEMSSRALARDPRYDWDRAAQIHERAYQAAVSARR